ncbi:MAG: sigma-70 family RNA polymerase sigma factor [Spirosomataceae bacterium]
MKSTLNTTDVKRLWHDYQEGDSFALAHLMQFYYQELYQWGKQLCQDRDLVKDCIQELFIGLWQARQRIAEVENVKAYLFKALRTRIVREVSKKHHQFLSISSGYDCDVAFSADTTLVEDERDLYQVRQLEHKLNQLPKRQKELIYLRFYQNMSYDEITDIMQIGRQPLYNLLQKALNSLRKNWIVYQLLMLFYTL